MTFISGQLCTLKVLEMSDVEAQIWSEAVNKGLTTQHLFTGSIPMRWIDVKKSWKESVDGGDILFGVWCDGHFIGTCGLHSHREIYRSWEARFLIFDPSYVGKGVGKEACTLLTKYAFERLNAHRVWLGVSSANIRAIKCYLDCGYRIEGTLRDEIFCYGKYHDAIRMSVLETDCRG